MCGAAKITVAEVEVREGEGVEVERVVEGERA